MTKARGLEKALIAAFFAALIALYAFNWFGPGIGLYREDAANLLDAKAIAARQGWPEGPPLFPLLLAGFTFISGQTQWLKSLPLACALGWLSLSWKLLRQMGASDRAALLTITLTATSPAVVRLAVNLFPEALFALLLTATLALLLRGHPPVAGLLAGLAALTNPAGVSLIAVCIVTLAIRGSFRAAILFTTAAMAVAAPWFGWSLAHSPHLPVLHPGSLGGVLLGIFKLLTGFQSAYPATVLVAILIWALTRRRHLLPDLFVAVYALSALFQDMPADRFFAPVLPLFLWMVLRAFQQIRFREAIAASAFILVALALWTDWGRYRADTADWRQMQLLFAAIREKAPPAAIIMADSDPAFYLNTGRPAIRGFVPNGYAVTADRLSSAIIANGVEFVALTANRDFPEAAAYRRAVESLERGGMLEAVPVNGVYRDYRLLRTISFGLPR